MDAAREMIFMAVPERRRMRVGDAVPSTGREERITRRTTRPDEPAQQVVEEVVGTESVTENQQAPQDLEGRDSEEQRMTRRVSRGETPEEQDARVEREKAAWQEQEARRKAAEAVLHQRLNESGKLAAQVGLPGLYEWKAQREVQRMDVERETEQVDYQSRVESTTQEIGRFMSEAQSSTASWEYRRSILGRARGMVSSHIGDLSAIKAKYHDKLADFAGATRMQGELEQKMSEVDKRRKFLEDYYSVLERLAGRDDLAGADLNRLSGEAATVSPEMVKNSSRMRVLARRRRNVWQEVA